VRVALSTRLSRLSLFRRLVFPVARSVRTGCLLITVRRFAGRARSTSRGRSGPRRWVPRCRPREGRRQRGVGCLRRSTGNRAEASARGRSEDDETRRRRFREPGRTLLEFAAHARNAPSSGRVSARHSSSTISRRWPAGITVRSVPLILWSTRACGSERKWWFETRKLFAGAHKRCVHFTLRDVGLGRRLGDR
jgi:hypothetical protein